MYLCGAGSSEIVIHYLIINMIRIERDILNDLRQWQTRRSGKPLIIQGARQIGKTWVMKRFGETCFEHVAYFNFDASPELCREFERTKDPARLLDMLRLYVDCPIEPARTLIIFDEIQQCNKALNSLKYFSEQAPEYPVLAAGSLLGVSLSQGDSFPVGQVEFLPMHPVSFREFLRASDAKLCAYIDGMTDLNPLPEMVMGKLTEAWRRYQVCGGMPAAAVAMLEGREMQAVESRQREILTSFAMDFAKHAPASDIPRIAAIWASIPSQLAKENRKFVYKLVKPGARAREYENGLLWLAHAGLIHRVFCSSKPGLPLSAYDDVSAFKIYLCDSGLLRVMAQLPPEIFWSDQPLYTEFKGAMAENAVLQSLAAHFDVLPRYWASEGTAEVDFLLQDGLRLLPVEVKSGTRLGGRSLGVYAKRYAPDMALRYSMNNLKKDAALLNIPLFLCDWTKQLLGFA